MSVSQDGSESVDQFLARIASVREDRDVASEERTRRKEEDFLKNRKERQARRLERARSLSPSKTGPSASIAVQRGLHSTHDTVLNPPIDFSPRASTLSRSNAVSARTSPKLEPKRSDPESSSPSQHISLSSSDTPGLSRSGTLSWQQRPTRGGEVHRPRPLSSIETIRPIARLEDEQSDEKPEPTRQEIAASLGLRDPTWFRQTQERGVGSAAFRKNQVEDTATVEHTTRSHGLVGMSGEASRSASATPAREVESPTPLREAKLSSPQNDRVGRDTSPTPIKLLNVSKLEPSPKQVLRVASQSPKVSDDLSRAESIRAGRSPSPTKGLGGFVESAMMKRSDSVNKRWSVQANAGLKRGDSIAGMRPLSGVRPMHVSSLSRSSTRDVSSSPISTSRPESREGPPGPKSRSTTPDEKRDVQVMLEESHSPKVNDDEVKPQTPTDEALSRSPSKTLDSKRWSPTKSSWLESALLSKPDPPKPQAAREEIPAWKATLQRNKAYKDLSLDKSRTVEAIARDTPLQTNTKTNHPPAIAKKPDSVPKDIDAVPEKPKLKDNGFTTQQQSPELAPLGSTGELSNVVEKAVSEVVQKDKPEKRPPPLLKPKPQTPPKTDFRSSLRSRAPTATDDHETEPEFKSIFGKLKRAQTQNYVAPDTLKDNILSGKAALAITGGPQKTQRVDEFKESILQKKEAMKANAIDKKEKPLATTNVTEPIVPEALARRKTLHKSSSPITKMPGSVGGLQGVAQAKPRPAIASKPQPSSIQPSASPPVTTKRPSSPARDLDQNNKPTLPGTELTESLPSLCQALPGVESTIHDQKPSVLDTQTESITVKGSGSIPAIAAKVELPAGSKLASRLNPNLAAFLTRSGSPQVAPGKSSSSERQNKEISKLIASDETEKGSSATGELTHMTKGRARGPKRRAPKSQPISETQTSGSLVEKPKSESTELPESKPKLPINRPIAISKEPSASQTLPRVIPAPKSASTVSLTKEEIEAVNRTSLDSEPKPKIKPAVASKSPQLRRVSSGVSSQQENGSISSSSNTGQFRIAADPENAVSTRIQHTHKEPSTAPRQSSVASPLTPSKSRINAPKPTQSPASSPAKSQSSKPSTGLGLSVPPLKPKPGASDSQLIPPPDRPRNSSSNVKLQPRGVPSENLAPVLTAYFAKPLDIQQKADFDAEELLARARESTEKIKSLSHAIWEVTGDGKRSAMPLQQEHILFEDSLYLLTHTLEGRSGSKVSEVYLWCGDGVADAAVEDAQFFCRRDAREHNTKLEVIKQGKEPPNFFQALGGILVLRRTKTSASYMLRGRRHLSHVSFDEVDFTSSALCSGFPHLVSATSGKLYLWKGRGSGADEVGCARLIGMDLGVTGEIEEIVEGEEPSSFWNTFSPRARNETKWSDDWQERASHNCYPTTLYRVELDRPKSAGGFWGLRAASPPKASNRAAIEMIYPFSGRDVDPSNVYVLDAYRSIYIIVDPLATTKSTEIVTAFHLAQDLAMLSPSVQDRSLIPSCFVVFGEPPADVKACFRKWDERNTARLGGGTDRDRLSTCARLEDVIEALKI